MTLRAPARALLCAALAWVPVFALAQERPRDVYLEVEESEHMELGTLLIHLRGELMAADFELHDTEDAYAHLYVFEDAEGLLSIDLDVGADADTRHLRLVLLPGDGETSLPPSDAAVLVAEYLRACFIADAYGGTSEAILPGAVERPAEAETADVSEAIESATVVVDGAATSAVRTLSLGGSTLAEGEEREPLRGFNVGVFGAVIPSRTLARGGGLRLGYEIGAVEVVTTWMGPLYGSRVTDDGGEAVLRDAHATVGVTGPVFYDRGLVLAPVVGVGVYLLDVDGRPVTGFMAQDQRHMSPELGVGFEARFSVSDHLALFGDVQGLVALDTYRVRIDGQEVARRGGASAAILAGVRWQR